VSYKHPKAQFNSEGEDMQEKQAVRIRT